MIEAHPLHWPAGWPRSRIRQEALFKATFVQARDDLLHEIDLLGGRDVILSTNVELRRDGLPYANQPEPQDAGVAVYFQLKKRPMVFACDKYRKVKDNVRAIGKTIEALRGIERWGASDMMERAFTGFEALPHLAEEPWHVVLMLPEDAPPDLVRRQYQKLRSENHPDHGGSDTQFNRIVQAFRQWEQTNG